MSRARADTILSGAPRIRSIQCDVLEAEGQWGVEEPTYYSANDAVVSSSSAGHGGGGGRDGGEVVTHDLYGDYDDDDVTPAPAPTTSSGGKTAVDNGVNITRQDGFSYKAEGQCGADDGAPNAVNSSSMTVNRWSVENNVALLVLKKELQIDRSAVRERRVAKKLDAASAMQTPRALAGSMSFQNANGSQSSMTPRGAPLMTPRPNGFTPRALGASCGSISSPRGSYMEYSRLGNTMSGGDFFLDGAALYAPPPPITVSMTDATMLSHPLQNEIKFLAEKCSAIESMAGIQSGEDIVSTTRTLHKRIQLLNERVVEELSNRVDVTVASIRYRDSKKDLLAVEAGLTEAEMGSAYVMSKVVEECYAHHMEALAIIRRLHSLRMLHQEAFQRVGALSLLRAATIDTNTFIANAPDEIEEMRLGTKEVNGAVNESLAYFRTRLQALASIK